MKMFPEVFSAIFKFQRTELDPTDVLSRPITFLDVDVITRIGTQSQHYLKVKSGYDVL